MSKKKVGLVLACKGTSYGMNLQAFATQCIVESLGYETEILNVYAGKFPFIWDWCLPIHLCRLLFRKSQKKQVRSNDAIHSENYKKRVVAAQEFRNSHLKNMSKKMSPNELTEYLKDSFQAVLVGSDQVWLPGFSFTNNTSLYFVPKGVKRVAYSSSLGVSTYPKYCYHSARKAWEQFDNIAVREIEGKKIIDEICNNKKDVQVVIDPTYLITKTQWCSIIPEKRLVKEKYVLSFILGNNIEQQQCASDFAKKNGLKLVSILSNESESPIDTTYADQIVVGAGPEDFINYIRGAEYIFTDSFHGIAFSVINEKQLFVFYRKRSDATGSMSRNSRIDNILRTWEIEQQLITDYASFSKLEQYPNVDYCRVNNILTNQRTRSLTILSESLQ